MNEIFEFSLTVLFLVVLLEQVGLPIPAAPCLLAAGALCVSGEASLTAVIGSTLLACLVADSGWFYLGRRSGPRVLSFLTRFGLYRNNDSHRLDRTFLQNGMLIVVLAKFVPGLSVAAPPLAGAAGIGFTRFLMFDLLGALLYAGTYLALGCIFSDQVQAILEILSRLGLGALLLLLAVAVGWIVFHHCNPRRKIA